MSSGHKKNKFNIFYPRKKESITSRKKGGIIHHKTFKIGLNKAERMRHERHR